MKVNLICLMSLMILLQISYGIEQHKGKEDNIDVSKVMFLRKEESVRAVTAAPASSSSNKGGSSSSKSDDQGALLGPCKTCIYVMERIKQGYQYLLPSICVEIHANNQQQEDFGKCQETIANLSIMGANVKSWLLNGCYKSEPYGAVEQVLPCPSHVICAQLKDLSGEPFCPPPTTDFNPDAAASTDESDSTNESST